jgi:hypothetical protein
MSAEGKDVFSASFDLPSFRKLFKDERKDLVFMARTAETAERYEDMCKFMRELVKWTDTKKAISRSRREIFFQSHTKT